MPKWLSIDPGETTGFAVWEDQTLVYAGQRGLWEFIDALAATSSLFGADVSFELQTGADPDLYDALEGWEWLVVEDWRLYPEVMASGGLDYDPCRTARGIGTFELLCRAGGRKIYLQPASIKSDAERAGAEQLFQRPVHENRHANDAIRHGTYWIARQRPDYTLTSTVKQTEGNVPA